MTKQRFPTVFFCFLLALGLALPAIAGVVYEIEVTDHEQSPPKSESIQAAVEGRHLKMGIASGGGNKQGEMIFRGDRREMVVVDHDNQSYSVMDKGTIEQLAGQVNQAMSQMAEALKNVPEDKRAMIEQMMKQNMPGAKAPVERAKSELKKTGEKATHSGYPCVKYEVWRDGQRVRELWVTDWDNLEGGGDAEDVFVDMADFFREMMDAIPDMGHGGAVKDDNMFEHLKDLGGFPVLTREFGDDGSLDGESALRSARRRTLDPAAFEPPSGYKRRSMGPQ